MHRISPLLGVLASAAPVGPHLPFPFDAMQEPRLWLPSNNMSVFRALMGGFMPLQIYIVALQLRPRWWCPN